MLNSILANMVAGLGLFFSGLRMLDANLRQTTGRQLRGIVGRLTRKGAHARLVLSVDLIGQAVSVEVDAADVRQY